MDYYLDPDEPPGRWWGNGRHDLGLDGTVTGDELRSVLEGRHPRSGVRLGRSFGDKSARGFDATFSAPKSVSVLWALTPDPWVRAEVLAAHDAAVDAALGWFQTHGAVTRRGTDGVFQVDTQGVTAALFRQHTSRTVDPQLHTHAIISSKVQDPDREMVVARCPVPQVPATQHRVDLRRRTPHRAHQQARSRLGRTGQRHART